jgi:hypothetical protein
LVYALHGLRKGDIIMFKALLFTSAVALSATAHAGFVHTDFATEGDQRVTLHEETGIEWLKVTNTTGLSVNQVLAETSDNGQYEGWRIPSADELDAYWHAIFEGSSMLNNPQGTRTSYSLYTSMAQDWVAFNGKQTASPIRSYGIGMATDGMYAHFGVSRTNQTTYWYAHGDIDANYTNVYMGVFLVSDGGASLSSMNNPSMNANNPNAPVNASANNVPIIGIGALSLLALGFRRQRR